MKELIQKEASSIFDNLVEYRRHIHRNPELSFEEEATGIYIKEVLTHEGISFTGDWGGHGVVAMIVGEKGDGPTIALRADIDALPIQELNDVEYASIVPGRMHACGHDVHTSSLIGAAIILNKLKAHFGGTIKCIFQPGEEKLPGGASLLINEGVLENPKPKTIVGQHVHPPLEAGKVGFCEGQYMASADEIYCTIRGRGGHAALPQNCIDTILLASQMIVSLQQIVSRRANPTIPTVLTFGKIYSVGGATNVIPDEVKIEGTFRTFDEAWRAEAHDIMKTMAESLVASMGGECEFKILKGYPYLYNDIELTMKCKEWAREYLGKENVVQLTKRTTAEDFAFYSHHVPACFYRLGTGNPALGINSPIHTPTFNIDESALKIGAGLMAYLAIQQLKLKH